MFFHLGPAPEPDSRQHGRACAIFRAGAGLVAFTLLAGPVLARTDTPLPLAEAEDLARRAEPGQEALQARAAALEERSVVAGELPDPMLRVGVNNFPLQSGGFSSEGMTSLSIGLRQTFPAGDSRAIGARQFASLAHAMRENADARERNVTTAVRAAWLDLYYWQEARELVVASRPFFADLADITRSLYAVGRKSQQDVLRAELELSRLDDRLIEIERAQSQARAALGEWIGTAALRPAAASLPDWNSLPPLEALQATLAEHPRLRAADAEIDASSAGVELAEQRAKPGWTLDFGYNYRDGHLPSGEPRSDLVTLGVTVGLPFFSRRSVDASLSAALQERTASRALREQALRELRGKLDAEYARWQDLGRRLDLYQGQILGQASAHAEASLLAYQGDRGDFAEVMRAYVADLNTRIEHIRLQVERARSYATLANLGGIPR